MNPVKMMAAVLVALPIAGTAAMVVAAAPPAQAHGPDPVIGRWSNPMGTLAVQTQSCRDGGTLCGAIVWASDRAQADARDVGVPSLIGTQLLQGYRRTGRADWSGRVYVPDMRRSFSSRIRQSSPTTLTISGCLIGGFLCKSQVWHRVA